MFIFCTGKEKYFGCLFWKRFSKRKKIYRKIYHEDEEVSFYSNFKNEYVRNVSLWNAFDAPIAVHTISLPRKAKEHFEVVNFDEPVILMPNKKSSVCQLKFVGPLNDVHYETRLRLLTNVTKFDIPLHVFNGKLRVKSCFRFFDSVKKF